MTALLASLMGISGLAVHAAATGGDIGNRGAPLIADDMEIVGLGSIDADSDATDESEVEQLVLPPTPAEMSSLASAITEKYQDDPRFASVEVTDARDLLIVHWFGEPDGELQQMAASQPTVATEIRGTEFQPGTLQEAVDELMRDDPHVQAGTPNHDGSGITVWVDQAQSRQAVAADLQSAFPFPVDIESGSVAPASSRQNDSYRIGGARISLFEEPYIVANCTSGFPVETRTGTKRLAIMTAAHCGTLNSTWITSDGVNAYTYGKMTERLTSWDGAIIDTGFSQPYVWTGTQNSTTIAPLYGQALPYVNQELCYSGSFSGVVCGNIVLSANYSYNLGGDLTSVRGLLSHQANDVPAAGNGDSGGPGYEIVNKHTHFERYGVAIISGIPGNSPAICTGEPGESGSTGRKCSPTVVSASVVTVGNNLGWKVSSN